MMDTLTAFENRCEGRYQCELADDQALADWIDARMLDFDDQDVSDALETDEMKALIAGYRARDGQQMIAAMDAALERLFKARKA